MTSPDLSAYRDIFFDEAREQMDVLEAFLVQGGGDVEEAFRAAHALKGSSATMGYEAVADAAHQLESQLDVIRRGGEVSPLLSKDFESLLVALGRSMTGEESHTLYLEVRADCMMPSVRAQIVVNDLAAVGTVVSVTPSPDLVTGPFAVVLASDKTRAELAELIGRLPEVSLRADEAPASKELPERRATARVSVERLDQSLNLASELMIERARLARSVGNLPDSAESAALRESADRVWKLAGQLQEVAMRARLVPVESVLRRLPKLALDVATKLGKTVEVDVLGGETEVDRSVLDVLGDPLIHMVRNAIDHGFESSLERLAMGKPAAGKLTIQAIPGDGDVSIVVADDGRGLNPADLRAAAVSKSVLSPEKASELSDHEAIELIFASGFTTVAVVSEVSGRGVGMDIVRSNIEKVGGRIEVESEVGVGTRFRLTLPLSLSVVRCLLVRCAGALYAIPVTNIVRTCRNPESGECLAAALDLPAGPCRFGFTVGIAGSEPRTFAVDELVSEEELVVKPISRLAGGCSAISGASILPDGQVVLILDPLKLGA